MKSNGSVILAVTVLWCGVVSPLSGFAMQPDPAPREAREPSAPERKAVRWYTLRRPRADTPAGQLALADGLREDGRLRKAVRAYDALVHRWHQQDEAVEAQMQVARLLHARGRYEKSFTEFQYLIDHFAGRFPYTEVIDYQYRIVRHVLERPRRRLFGFSDPERVVPLLKQVVANAPAHDQAPQAALKTGMIYEDAAKFEEASVAYEQVLQRYPRSDEAVEAAFRRAVCLVRMSDRSPRDEAQARSALAALASFLNRYPESPFRGEVLEHRAALMTRVAELHYAIAEFYDRRAKRPEAALIAYRDYLATFPESTRRGAVEARVHELERTVQP